MLTHPGFADQPKQSNILVQQGAARLLRGFNYPEMDRLLTEVLQTDVYDKMVSCLKVMHANQVKLGGYQRGAEIIEEVIEGKLKFIDGVAPEEGFGYQVTTVRCLITAVLITLLLFLLLCIYLLNKLLKLCCGASKTSSKKTN